MTIYLYNYDGETNVIDKTGMLSPAEGVQVSGTLRGNCGILRPAFLIEGTPTSYNYMHVPAFGRYYFLDSPQAVRNGLYMLSGTVDALYSHKVGVLACPAIAARAAKPECQNAYLIDDRVQPYAPQTVCTRLLFPDAFTYGAEPRYILVTTG